jgi:glucose/arabinose dehydrogenase
VSSFRVRAERPNAASPDSEEIVLRIEQPYGNHNGGALAFGADGHLYIATGDGGSGGDPHDNGQRLDSLLGAILRIDIDNRADGLGYAIPDDNPFAGDANARPEIWHYGLRNPWRISFDPPTGDLWIGDVGQSRFEEISVARRGAAGLNFGWARMEGFGCFPSPNGCVRPEFTLPVTDYTHDHGCAVVGGLVYRGTDFPSLVGGYLFADYCSGIIWAIDSGADEVRPPTIVAETGRAISSFGWNEAGEVYATDLAGGQLLRVVVR